MHHLPQSLKCSTKVATGVKRGSPAHMVQLNVPRSRQGLLRKVHLHAACGVTAPMYSQYWKQMFPCSQYARRITHVKTIAEAGVDNGTWSLVRSDHTCARVPSLESILPQEPHMQAPPQAPEPPLEA
jgi:hypothetical protein